MSRENTGTDGLFLGSYPISPPFSMGCWLRPGPAPGAAGTLAAFCRSASAGGFFGLRFRTNLADNPIEAIHQGNSGAVVSALQTGGVLEAWQYALAVFASNSSRTIYLNGVGTTDTTAVDATTPDQFSALYAARGPSPGGYFVGSIAHLSVWTAALNSTEAGQLAAGANPAMIRSASYGRYWRLAGTDSPEPEAAGGPGLVPTGTTAGASNPSVWTPWGYDSTLVRGGAF